MSKSKTIPLIFYLFSIAITTSSCTTLDNNFAINSEANYQYIRTVENPKNFKRECDNKSVAKACFNYAFYNNIVRENYPIAYEYYKKSYELGVIRAGYFISTIQLNYPELFTKDERLSIDESIYYLEQAFKAGSPDATRYLMLVYRTPEYGHIDYKKSEYYNKIAIEQNVRHASFSLATLYLIDMEDKSKTEEVIALFKEDLMTEKNWASAFELSAIYLYPDKFGANFEQDIIKSLAYAYISSDLRNDSHNNQFSNMDNKLINLMEQHLPMAKVQQAKALHQQIMNEMNEYGS